MSSDPVVSVFPDPDSQTVWTKMSGHKSTRNSSTAVDYGCGCGMLTRMTHHNHITKHPIQQTKHSSCNEPTHVSKVSKQAVGDIMWSHFGIVESSDHSSEDRIVVPIKDIEAALHDAFNAGLDGIRDTKFSS